MEGFKFRRQQPIGRYVVDFVNLEKKLVVELDGGQHAIDVGDKIRDEWLRAEGYEVLRFWDNQVLSNSEGVLETIRDALLTPHPDPLPQGAVSQYENAAFRKKGEAVGWKRFRAATFNRLDSGSPTL